MSEKSKRKWKERLVLAIILIPGLVFFIGGIVYPLMHSLYMSLFDAQGIARGDFVGLKNYMDIFRDDVFWLSVRNCIFLALGYILISHPIALIVGWNIRKLGPKLEKVFRTILFMPAVINLIVLVKIWVFMYNPDYGSINALLNDIGLGFLAQKWLNDPHTALASVIMMTIWIGWSWSFLYDYVAIKSLPEDVFEAARVDGACGIKLHYYVTLPLLLPIISVFLATAIINAFKVMEIIMLSTDGGPLNLTEFVANYMYKKAFRTYQLGYANTISIVIAVICLIITLVYFRLTKLQDEKGE